MISQGVLQQLADQNWHTGASMGEALGIGRSAIWKQIEELRALGVHIESDRSKGYRLGDDVALIERDEVIANLDRASGLGIETHHSIDSTNTRAMDLIQGGESPLPFAVFADHQTAGRGRRGRQWVSPIGRSLYVSIAWRFEQGISELSGLSLVVAIAIRRALLEAGVEGVFFKWPNDLLGSLDGRDFRKLAGVLIEIQGEATGPCAVVIGIGLNISLSDCAEDALPPIDQPWIDVKTLCRQSGDAVNRNRLAAGVLNQLAACLGEFTQHGFEAFKQDWHEGDAMLGESVAVLICERAVEGECLGVDDNGGLLLSVDGVTQQFNAGEVSLRRR